MKTCFALLAFATVAYAGHLYGPHAALINTGTSAQYRNQDNIGNYAFGYNEDHSTGGTFRRESGSADGSKVGSYGLRDADGRLRIVNYVADAAGFRVNIQSNEPGVEPKDPAATLINKAPLEVAHAPVAHAPVLAAAPAHYAAPIVAAPAAPVAHFAAPAHYAAAPVHAPVAVAAPHKAFSYTVVNQGHVAPQYAGHLGYAGFGHHF